MIKIFVPIKLTSQRLPNNMMLKLGDKLLCQPIFFTLLDVKKDIACEIYCFCSDHRPSSRPRWPNITVGDIDT